MRRRISSLIAIGVALMAVAGCESGKKTALLTPPAAVFSSESSVSGMLTTAEAQPAGPVAPPPYMPASTDCMRATSRSTILGVAVSGSLVSADGGHLAL